MKDLDKKTFEGCAEALVKTYPEGMEDDRWRIKYDLIDGEYFIRWTNGDMGRGHKEWACYYKNGEFIYY